MKADRQGTKKADPAKILSFLRGQPNDSVEFKKTVFPDNIVLMLRHGNVWCNIYAAV